METTTWRPAARIQVKALGLHLRCGRLLAAEVYNDDGSVKGVRPLGGSVEFGESAKAAVVREFREELGIDVDIVGEPAVVENFYNHHDVPGHEVIFVFEVAFPPGAFEGQERIAFRESDGALCSAGWFDPRELDREGAPELYPSGLKSLLASRAFGGPA